MARNPLALHSLPRIALAYLVAPPACLAVMFAAGSVIAGPAGLGVRIDEDNVRIGMQIAVLFFLAELVVVTPLLLAYQRWRWGWLNTWTAVLVAFAICFLVPFGLSLWIDWSGYPDAVPALLRVIAGEAVSSLPFGLFGVAGVLVFRLLAVRREEVVLTPA